MEKSILKYVCTKITDGSHNPPEGIVHSDFMMISSKNVDDDIITLDAPRYLSEKDFNKENKRTNILSDDILMTIVGTVGRVAVVSKNIQNLTVQRSVCVLKPKSDMIIPRYLMYQLQSKRNYLEKESHGVAQKGIYLKQVEEIPIILPSKEEQKDVVFSLDKVSQLIVLRKKQLQKLDDLVKARFVEMFGDTFSNPKKWPTLTFREAALRLSDGPFGSNLKSEHYSNEGIRVIRLGNIGVGRFIDDDKSCIPDEHYQRLKKYTCRTGDIVIGTLGEPNLRACLVPEHVGIAVNKADCVHYIPKPDILDNAFVCQYINCPTTLLFASGMIHGQTRARVSSGQIAEMPVFVPPIKLQKQFSMYCKQVDKSKLSIQQGLEKLETLKKSLMQQYFG